MSPISTCCFTKQCLAIICFDLLKLPLLIIPIADILSCIRLTGFFIFKPRFCRRLSIHNTYGTDSSTATSSDSVEDLVTNFVLKDLVATTVSIGNDNFSMSLHVSVKRMRCVTVNCASKTMSTIFAGIPSSRPTSNALKLFSPVLMPMFGTSIVGNDLCDIVSHSSLCLLFILK